MLPRRLGMVGVVRRESGRRCNQTITYKTGQSPAQNSPTLESGARRRWALDEKVDGSLPTGGSEPSAMFGNANMDYSHICLFDSCKKVKT